MSIDVILERSYRLYIQAAAQFSVIPVDMKEYRDLLFSAAAALKEVPVDEQDKYPFVFVRVKDIYMKAKKIGENLDISFMDKETFDLTVKYKQGA